MTNSARLNIAPVSHDQAARPNRREDDMSDPLEGTTRMHAQRGNNSQNYRGPASSQIEARET